MVLVAVVVLSGSIAIILIITSSLFILKQKQGKFVVIIMYCFIQMFDKTYL